MTDDNYDEMSVQELEIAYSDRVDQVQAKLAVLNDGSFPAGIEPIPTNESLDINETNKPGWVGLIRCLDLGLEMMGAA